VSFTGATRAVLVNSGMVNFSNCVFANNTNGTSVFFNSVRKPILVAVGAGGAVQVNGGSVSFANCAFTGNTATACTVASPLVDRSRILSGL